MQVKKVNGTMVIDNEVMKGFYEKKSDKVWFRIPDKFVSVLNRNLIGMKKEMFDKAEEGATWDIEPKEKLIDRSGNGPKKDQTKAEHWSNYLNEADKKLYDELEARGQAARKAAYEKSSKQRQIEKLQAQLAALQAEVAACDK